MPYFEKVFLHCLSCMNGERTIYAIYHLLKGKKSSQTIQDAHLFGLSKWFQSIEFLTREMVDHTVERLEGIGWISKISDQHYVLTQAGQGKLHEEFPQENSLVYLDGWKNQNAAAMFWSRLSLLVQVISNLMYGETKYVPIQKDKKVHIWLKDMLSKTEYDRETLSLKLLSELTEALREQNDIQPDLLVLRLTGHEFIGLTPRQAAAFLSMDDVQYHIEFKHSLHYLIQKASENKEKFVLLNQLIHEQNEILTLSTKKTYDMLKSGFSLEQIATLRNLKKSTIEDHIVELSINLKDFSIHPFVSEERITKIKGYIQETGTKQLRLIREKILEASYFEIRLVIAKYGDQI